MLQQQQIFLQMKLEGLIKMLLYSPTQLTQKNLNSINQPLNQIELELGG